MLRVLLLSALGVIGMVALPAVASATRYQQISAGNYHTCAVTVEQTLHCWGDNGLGQLGDGTNNWSIAPVAVKGLAQVSQVSAGEDYSCAIASAAVWCWGKNNYGQLGDGSKRDRNKPVKVAGIDNATQVATGKNFSCALLADHSARCWGHDLWGYQTMLSPRPVVTQAPLRQLAVSGWRLCGSYIEPFTSCIQGILYEDPAFSISEAVESLSLGTDHGCGVFVGDAVKCWGSNRFGQLGIPGDVDAINPGPPLLEPLRAVPGVSARSVDSGKLFSCAVLVTGQLRCWGIYIAGQLGGGKAASYQNHRTQTVLGINNARQVSTGENHACALLDDGAIRCWGAAAVGQLGNGLMVDPRQFAPAPVVDGPVWATVLLRPSIWDSDQGDIAVDRQGQVVAAVICLKRAKARCSGSVGIAVRKHGQVRRSYRLRPGQRRIVKLRLPLSVQKLLRRKKSVPGTVLFRERHSVMPDRQDIRLRRVRGL